MTEAGCQEPGDIGKERSALLKALALMCWQHMTDSDYVIDHKCIYAGEYAVDLLAEYGLVEPHHRGGIWTPAGRILLDSIR